MTPGGGGGLLHDLIADVVERYGARCAVEVPSSDPNGHRTRITYAALDAEAEQLRALLAPSVSRECIVAIMLPRTATSWFAAQWAVLRSGAAFVCIDPNGPLDSVEFVLRDSGAVAVLTDEDGRAKLANVTDGCEIIDVAQDPSTVARACDWLTPSSLAYVVYTSGTTGRPKGVMIEHRSIVHLICAELDHFELVPEDRCVLVSSPIYDSSIEEAWLPFAAGATVVVADESTLRLGPDLVAWLRAVGASTLMPTPTLLRMTVCSDPASELPDLRIVYAGGEAFPQDLADRWAPGRRLENGYGPTECTVTITRTRLRVGQPVTIGQPIAGNTAHVLDEALEPVADGEVGELCIAGPQVARGYLNRPELTSERFPTVDGVGRLYRTGDLVKRDARGDLHYLGRADSQVKLRGYRIELEEIEVQLARIAGVAAAACRVASIGGSQRLEAFFVPTSPESAPSAEQLANQLRDVLPAHMVPSRFWALERLPTTAGGKLDRRALPTPDAPRSHGGVEPRDELERVIAQALARPFGLVELGIDDDFFAVGGDSLGVAIAVSELRGHPRTARIAARDIYEQRTVRHLAESIRGRAGPVEEHERVSHASAHSGAFPRLVTLAQVGCLIAVLAFASCVAYIGIFWLLPWLIHAIGVVALLLLAPAALFVIGVLYLPLAVAVAVVAKRVLIGRYSARRVAVWSGYYLRHWIVVRVVGMVPWRLLQGTVFYGAALRALGARVGERVHIHRGVDLLGGGWDLLDIGDDVTLSQDASVGLVHLEDGDLVIGPVRLEAGCTLEVRAGVGEHTVIGAGAEIGALSYVPAHESIEPNARFAGVPARRVGVASEPPAVDGRGMDPRAHGLALIVVSLGVQAALAIPGFAVAIVLWMLFDIEDSVAAEWIRAPFDSPLACSVIASLGVVSVVASHGLLALALRLTKSVAAGSISRWSGAYIRVWIRTGFLDSAGRLLSGSLFWRWWLRLAGMRLGDNCEVSTILDVLPEQVAIGDESFFADGVYLAGPEIKRGVVTMAEVEVGARVFLGNHVVVPPGTRLPSDVLIGVATVADGASMRSGSAWFGHPAFELPRREVVACDRRLTHEPTRALYLHRLVWEALRFVIPAVLLVATLAWVELAVAGLFDAAIASVVVGLALLAAVCALKWVLLGRVRPGQHGFWSCWVARWDFLYMAWGMVARAVLSPFGGTLLLPWYLRAMGVRVGRRVVLGGEFAQVVDPDMLAFGDGATIDRPMFQAHSFEDRVLKIDRIVIEAGASVGRATVLFYGARLGDGCLVAPHSVVMKGERLTPRCAYAGAPTRPATAAS